MKLFITFQHQSAKSLCIRVFFLILMAGFVPIHGQDTKLSTFNYNPLFLNPAHTGNFYGNWRAAISYRNQWAATGDPYTVAVAGIDVPMKFRNHNYGLGLIFVDDHSKSITQDKIALSAGYSYKLSDNFFSGGLQVGFVSNSSGNANWRNYNPLTNQPDLPNGEPGAIAEPGYLDIDFGIIWRRSIGKFEPEAGISFSHLNQPNQSFLGGTEKVPVNTTLHGAVKTNLSDEIYVLPTFLISSSNSNTTTILGAQAGYRLLGNRSSLKEVFGGITVRNGVSSSLSDISMLIGATVGRLDVALSYDINVSGLSQSTNVSTFEISLIYKSISTVLNSYSIPCERF